MGNGIDIVFENVSFSYAPDAPDAPDALAGIDLRIEAGEFVAVLGANGSGKSTLARHVNGLLVPTQGTVRVDGANTSDAHESLHVRRNVGMVFQNPDNQAVASTVRDDVAFGPENLGLDPGEIQARVDEALERTGMQGHADAQIHELSGGQKQLVAIAGALAMHPRALVLDEPGAMLDARGRERIVGLLHELNVDGMTVVLVTHFMDEALGADRVVVLDAGSIALAGGPRDVFADAAKLRDLQLALPFSLELAERLSARGVELDGAGASGDAALLQALAASGVQAHAVADASTSAAATPASVPDPFIAFEHVGFRYETATRDALADIGCELAAGSVWGLAGHTGSGKSTFAQLADALLVPTSGRVVVDGTDTAVKRTRRSVRERVGVAFQYPEQQLFAATVAQDVAFGPRNLGLDEAHAAERAREALAAMGLDYDELAERSPFRLSGGQQRRVALAGILAMKPRFIVLDEPTAGMDPLAARALLARLRALNESGTGLLLISHSMDDIAALCEQILVLERGHVLFRGTPADVFTKEHAPELQRTGIGLPRAAAFALQLEAAGFTFSRLPLTVAQLADMLAPADAAPKHTHDTP